MAALDRVLRQEDHVFRIVTYGVSCITPTPEVGAQSEISLHLDPQRDFPTEGDNPIFASIRGPSDDVDQAPSGNQIVGKVVRTSIGFEFAIVGSSSFLSHTLAGLAVIDRTRCYLTITLEDPISDLEMGKPYFVVGARFVSQMFET